MLRVSTGYSTDLWLSPEQVSGTPSSQHVRHALSIGPEATGGIPVGHRRRRLVSPSLTTGRPDATPALSLAAPASGPKGPEPPRPSLTVAPIPHVPSPQESLTWSPTAFTHTRARLPRSLGECPGPAQANTPAPHI